MQTRRIKDIDHFIFDNKKEFERHFLEKEGAVPTLVKDWHKAKVGDWVIADDKGVVQIIKIKFATSRTTHGIATLPVVNTPVGIFLAHPERRNQMPYFMDTDLSKHEDRNRFNGKFPKNAESLRKHKLTTKLRLFASKFALGHDPYVLVEEIFNPADVETKLRQILKSEKVMAEIKENMRSLAIDAGYDDKYIFDRLDELINKTITKNPSITLDTIKLFGEIIGTIDKPAIGKGLVGAVTAFGGFHPKALEGLKDEAEDVEVVDGKSKSSR